MREQKAFLIDPPARLHPYTVPEPFRLHDHDGPDERTERARAEVEAEHASQCTFKPETNEMSVEALLRLRSGGRRDGYARRA